MFSDSNPAEGDAVLRAIKIHNTYFFEGANKAVGCMS
jgi:hypothetical protein